MGQHLEWFEHRPQHLAQVHVIWFVSNIKFTLSSSKIIKLVWDPFWKENAYVYIVIPINRIVYNWTRHSYVFFHLFALFYTMLSILRKYKSSHGNFHSLGKGNLLIFSLKYQIIKQIINIFSVILVCLLFLNLPICYC